MAMAVSSPVVVYRKYQFMVIKVAEHKENIKEWEQNVWRGWLKPLF